MGKRLNITDTTCPYCGVGCGVAVENQGESVAGLSDHPANLGRLCVKGANLHETLDHRNRLLRPELYDHPVDWDTALDYLVRRLRDTLQRYGPDSVAMYGSGQLLTEDYYAANKLMKGFIGSSHMDTNSRLCMASAVAGYKRAFGSDTVPGCYEDLEIANLMVLVGSNAAWTHPVLFQRMAAAKQQRPDMKVVVIDPRHTASCDLADLHLPLRPGADGLLFNGLLTWLADNHCLDQNYIDRHTRDFAATLEKARMDAGNLRQLAAATDLDPSALETFFRWFGERERTVTFYSQGINQSATGTDKCNAIINCHLATGRVGRPGASPFSITGQPNAMGGREVGGLANQLAAHMDFTPRDIDRVSRFWGAANMASSPGLKAVDMFRAVESGRIRFLWILSTNPLVSLPEANRMREALRRCPTVVVSECMADTETVRLADIRLPACTWGEKDGTVTNSERCISRQRPFLSPAGEARPDWWALAQTGQRLGYVDAFNWRHPAQIFTEHAALSGFENHGERLFDISGLAALGQDDYDRLAPVRWPVNADFPDGRKRLFDDHAFPTDDGRARFIPTRATLPDKPRQHGDLVMNTGRVRDQWHTMTRTGKTRRLLQHISEPFVAVHPHDARKHGIEDGQLARVGSEFGDVVVRVQCTTDQRRGEVFVPMHWSQPYSNRARMGALIQADTDPVSGQPESKFTRVTLRPCPITWQGFLIMRTRLRQPDCFYWSYAPLPHGHLYELAGTDDVAVARERLRHLIARPGNAQRQEWLQMADSARGHFRDAAILDGALQGALFLHTSPALPSCEWLAQMLEEDSLTQQQRRALLSGRAPDGSDDIGAVICSCFQVGEKQIRERIAAGDDSVEALGESLSCGTNCGSCVPELKKLLV
jgi:assimilatory nitrate reductase catalytic subunit